MFDVERAQPGELYAWRDEHPDPDDELGQRWAVLEVVSVQVDGLECWFDGKTFPEPPATVDVERLTRIPLHDRWFIPNSEPTPIKLPLEQIERVRLLKVTRVESGGG